MIAEPPSEGATQLTRRDVELDAVTVGVAGSDGVVTGLTVTLTVSEFVREPVSVTVSVRVTFVLDVTLGAVQVVSSWLAAANVPPGDDVHA